MITIICANDMMILGFVPDTSEDTIEEEFQRLKEEYLEKYPPSFVGGQSPVYVHKHEVEVYQKNCDNRLGRR